MILKIILFALCANLLYTNANLMIAASSSLQGWQTVMMVIFALTYSLISTLSLYKLQSMFAIVCFAVLDGFAVLTHLSEHSANFKTVVGVYFGIYTTYTLIVAYVIKRHDEAKGEGTKDVEGHDAAYWYKCFMFQKQRADGVTINKPQTDSEFREPTKMIEDKQKELPDVRKVIGGVEIPLSIKRAFARMTDPDKRRERIKDLPEEVKNEIVRIYGL